MRFRRARRRRGKAVEGTEGIPTLRRPPLLRRPAENPQRSKPSPLGKKGSVEKSNDTQTGVLLGMPRSARCIQRFDDSLKICNSHYVSRFAAFFIDARAKRSIAESCIRFPIFPPFPSSPGAHVRKAAKKARHKPMRVRQSRRVPPRLPLETPRRVHRCVCESVRGVAPSRLGNDPSAGSPTETLLRLLLPLNDQV